MRCGSKQPPSLARQPPKQSPSLARQSGTPYGEQAPIRARQTTLAFPLSDHSGLPSFCAFLPAMRRRRAGQAVGPSGGYLPADAGGQGRVVSAVYSTTCRNSSVPSSLPFSMPCRSLCSLPASLPCALPLQEALGSAEQQSTWGSDNGVQSAGNARGHRRPFRLPSLLTQAVLARTRGRAEGLLSKRRLPAHP